MTRKEIQEGRDHAIVNKIGDVCSIETNGLLVAVPDPKNLGFTVSTHRVVFDRYLNNMSSDFLVKFTDEKYSLQKKDVDLQLATAGFYRGEDSSEYSDNPTEDEAHIDLHESAVYIPEGMYSIDIRPGGDPRPVPMLVRTLYTEDNWLFCTSAIRCDDLDGSLDTVREFLDFGRSSYSVIRGQDIDEFAFLLGIRYGLDVAPRIGEVYHLGETPGGVPGFYEDIAESGYRLQVTHGRVKYLDDPSGFVRKHTRDLRERTHLSNFVKKTKFSYQSEYRFAIHGWGHLKIQKTLVPLEEDLRKLFSVHGRTKDLFSALKQGHVPQAWLGASQRIQELGEAEDHD